MFAGELRDLLIELQSKFPDLNIPSTELLKIDRLERERINNGSTLTFNDFLNLLTSVSPSKGERTDNIITDASLQSKIDSQFEEIRRLRDELSSSQEISDDCRIECGQLQLEIKRCRKELSIEQESNAQRASMIHKMEDEINYSKKSINKMVPDSRSITNTVANSSSSTCLPAHRSLYRLELLAKNLSIANKHISNDRNQLYQHLFSLLQEGKSSSQIIKTLIECQKRIPSSLITSSKDLSSSPISYHNWKYLFIFLLGMFTSTILLLLLLYGTLSSTILSINSKAIPSTLYDGDNGFNPIF